MKNKKKAFATWNDNGTNKKIEIIDEIKAGSRKVVLAVTDTRDLVCVLKSKIKINKKAVNV